MDYACLIDTYESERLKTVSVWSMFRDEDFDIRPHSLLGRDRTAHEHMVHQCMSDGCRFYTRTCYPFKIIPKSAISKTP